MINVEGVYEEIIDWIDTFKPNRPIQHVMSHGTPGCYGLFTVVDSRDASKGRWVMYHSHLSGATSYFGRWHVAELDDPATIRF